MTRRSTSDGAGGARREWVWVGLLIALGFALRLYQIDRYCFVLDEVHSVNMATGSEREDDVVSGRTISAGAVFNQMATRDVHPPLYFVVLNLWLKRFGTSEGAARAVAIPFMVACIPLAYLIGRRLSGRSAALLAATVMTLSPFQIRYTQDLRMYGMMQFSVLLATVLFLRLLEEPKPKLWLPVAYGLAVALGMLTHYFSVYTFVLHAGWFLYLRGRRMSPLTVRRFGLAIALALLLFSGWVIYAGLDRMQRTYSDTRWLEQEKDYAYFGPRLVPIGLFHLIRFGSAVAGARAEWALDRWAIVLILLALLFFGLVRLARQRGKPLFIIAWIGVPLGGMIAVDVVTGRHAFEIPRYLITAALPTYLLLAYGVALFRPRAVRVALAVLLLGAVGGALYRYEAVDQLVPPYDRLARLIEAQADGRTVLYPVEAHSINYYMTDPAVQLQRGYGVPPEELVRFLAENEEIWVIGTPRRSDQTAEEFDKIRALLRPSFEPVPGKRTSLESVEMVLYRRTTPAAPASATP